MTDEKNTRAGRASSAKRNAGRPAEASPERPFVVAVGASAAVPDSLATLLGTLTRAPDHAVVIALQHREALDEERFRELFAAHDGALSPIHDGAPLEGGHVYLGDPDVIVTVANGRFRTRQAEQRPGSRGTIDSFFVSLAEDQGEAALGVILRGTAGEGTLGLATMKERGGLTIAEKAPGESVADLATSNLPGALADFVVPLEEIPERIAAYARHLARLRERKGLDTMMAEVAGALGQIAAILRNKTGHDFHGYKQQTFLRRVQRRMQVVQVDEVEAYGKLLRGNPEEVQNLFNDLLIGVTQFFRDPKEFEVLEREVVPAILEGKDAGNPVRVWVLGCATGEEAYSIAILLKEEMNRRDVNPQVQIFATDIDARALAAARVGRYPATIAADVTPERLARWFVKEGNTYCVVKELREMCIFSAHNVIRDAPFSRLELISCRNLLIYLNPELQSRVIPLFHFGLLPDRFLFLGNSENVTRHPKLFAPIDRRARIFRKLDTGTRQLPQFPIAAPGWRRAEAPAVPGPRTAWDGGLARRAERVVERYAPAYIVADEEFQVLHFSGRTGRYLEPTSGAASLDLLNLVHRDLRLDLRAALMKAAEQDQPARVDHLQMRADGDVLEVDLAVEPVRELPDGPRSFVVLFKDGGPRPKAKERPDPDELRDDHVLRLQAELRLMRERLHATIEELESTNEELKSSNEEYQSLNEELQSANEELETSREELQSVNEELTTVNSELAHRVQELTRATSDLKNFLEATQIATLFLDNDLKVMNFTPALGEIFHLVETDIGRPIAHIKSRIPFEELQEDLRRVLRTLTSLERSLDNTTTGARYIVRILPYRSVDNFIAGVVVTFVDVTALTRAEEHQKVLLAELQHRVRNTLAVVRAIARRTAGTSQTVEECAAHLEGRLDAFARVQAAVTRNPSAGIDLEQLVAEELLAHGAHEGEKVTEIRGAKVRLNAKAAEMLALAVHELATNAVKYGALASDTGRLAVTWTVEPGDKAPRLRFNWTESGVHLADGVPTRRGFGTELIERTLSYELDAETRLEYRQGGAHCTIVVPPDRPHRGPRGAGVRCAVLHPRPPLCATRTRGTMAS